MLSWLAPFVVLAVVVLLYLYAAKGGNETARSAMVRDINYYMVCVLGVSIVSIIAGLRVERDWLDLAAWVLGAVAIVAAVWRFKTSEPVETKADEGPLALNSLLPHETDAKKKPDDRGPLK